MWFRRRRMPTQFVERHERCRACGASVGIYERTCPSCASSLVGEKKRLLLELRDRGSMTPAALDVALGILGGKDEPQVAEDWPARREPAIRKQVTELGAADLQQCPVWEFALDEEGLEEQDEETVRPRPDVGRVDPRDGLYGVRAAFTAADGAEFGGFVSPHADRHVGHVQPTIVAGDTHIRFWFGIVPPTRSVLDSSYDALGKDGTELFPLSYRALVETVAVEAEGTLGGFMHYADGRTDEIVTVR